MIKDLVEMQRMAKNMPVYDETQPRQAPLRDRLLEYLAESLSPLPGNIVLIDLLGNYSEQTGSYF